MKLAMHSLKLLALLSASFHTASGAADPKDAPESEADNPSTSPNLAINITTHFPSAEVFGIKLVNGVKSDAVLSLTNNEPGPVTLQIVGGSLWSPDLTDPNTTPTLVRNLTAVRYGGTVPPGESETFEYEIKTEMHPADLTLKLGAVVSDSEGAFYTIGAFEGSVSVVERPMSVFDPQVIFLYFILLAAFGGTAYFIYSTWITTLFPQTKGKRGKGGERAKTSSGGSKSVDPTQQVGVVGADGPAVTSAKQLYDQSWIPQQHLQRPEAKRIRSGTPSGIKKIGGVRSP